MKQTDRISKEEAQRIIRADVEKNGKPRPRRAYADEWGVPPSTAYYWIREVQEEVAA